MLSQQLFIPVDVIVIIVTIILLVLEGRNMEVRVTNKNRRINEWERKQRYGGSDDGQD